MGCPRNQIRFVANLCPMLPGCPLTPKQDGRLFFADFCSDWLKGSDGLIMEAARAREVEQAMGARARRRAWASQTMTRLRHAAAGRVFDAGWASKR